MSACKLAIGIATAGSVKSRTVFSLCKALKDFPYDYEVFLKEGASLSADRITLVKVAKEMKCTHILFLDSDMSFPKDAITRLLDRNKDIIGVHYNQRQLPLLSTVVLDERNRYLPEKDLPELRTCYGVGTGFVLINLSVFDKLPQPWFNLETDKNGELTLSEDFWFSRLAREVGYKIWVDLTIPIKHVGDYLY